MSPLASSLTILVSLAAICAGALFAIGGATTAVMIPDRAARNAGIAADAGGAALFIVGASALLQAATA